MTTSIHYGGFWFHIKWKGDMGVDQRGRLWSNRLNPTPDNMPWLKPMCEIMSDTILLMLNKLNHARTN